MFFEKICPQPSEKSKNYFKIEALCQAIEGKDIDW